MPTDHASLETRGWLGAAFLFVGAVVVLRLVALAFNRTDLFVDESQYWLWGRNLDFGYYSKPPLIGWLIRAVTTVAGSDAPFWVRMPGPVLHGATALILGAHGVRLFGARAGFWVAASYVTTPFATVGSLLISTDTVMAPAFAGALYAWFRLAETRAAHFAVLAGAAVGVAFLAKYAAIYFLLGAGLSAALVPSMRVGWRNALVLAGVFVVVISPNILWNLTHGFVTLHHTVDNADWGDSDDPAIRSHGRELFDFVTAQFAVFGPVLFAALVATSLSVWRAAGSPRMRALVLFALPALIVICVQAYMSRAYANWAVAAYFAGALVAVGGLSDRAPRLLWLSLALNGLVALAVPALTITAPFPQNDGRPLLHRYLGRADLSTAIIAAARSAGAGAVFAGDRDILADLFYSGRASGLAFYGPRPEARPRNYYEQNFPLPTEHGPVLFVLGNPPVCSGQAVPPVARFDTAGGAYEPVSLAGYMLPAGCVDGAD